MMRDYYQQATPSPNVRHTMRYTPDHGWLPTYTVPQCVLDDPLSQEAANALASICHDYDEREERGEFDTHPVEEDLPASSDVFWMHPDELITGMNTPPRHGTQTHPTTPAKHHMQSPQPMQQVLTPSRFLRDLHCYETMPQLVQPPIPPPEIQQFNYMGQQRPQTTAVQPIPFQLPTTYEIQPPEEPVVQKQKRKRNGHSDRVRKNRNPTVELIANNFNTTTKQISRIATYYLLKVFTDAKNEWVNETRIRNGLKPFLQAYINNNPTYVIQTKPRCTQLLTFETAVRYISKTFNPATVTLESFLVMGLLEQKIENQVIWYRTTPKFTTNFI